MSLWIGASLGPVERACLRSVIRQGHALTLYCYRVPKGIPAEVRVEDASEILPQEMVFKHGGGSVALFSDWFRYELQRRGLGTWVDTDLYLLAPLPAERPYLFGEQEPGVINNAVLRLPMDSPVLDDLLQPFHHKLPPWLPIRDSLYQRWHKLRTGRLDLQRLRWGMTGPAALTWAARCYGIAAEALAPHIFYPAPWKRAEWITDPTVRLDDIVRPETIGVHLWNECIKVLKDRPPALGSFLARLHNEGRA